MIKTTTPKSIKLEIESEELLCYLNEKQNEEPRQHVIDNLLRFSRALEITPSKLVGTIESVMN